MRRLEHIFYLGLFVRAHAEAFHRIGFAALIEEAQAHALRMDGGNSGDPNIQGAAVGFETNAAILRETFFGDVESSHDFQARDNRILEAQQIIRYWHENE